MATKGPYGSPAAFRRAITDRLRDHAETSRWSLPELQRQIAYDRLLDRLYLADDQWIVKGAAALLARDFAVRATIDIDLFRSAAADIAAEDVRAAAARDVGDWFRFEVGVGQAMAAGVSGVRLPVRAFIGATEWCAFHIDVVGPGIVMTGQPESVPALVPVEMPGIQRRYFRAYPLVDHIADKVTAILQTYGPELEVSTRYKDLVDLVAIVSKGSVHANAQRAALESEAHRRGIMLPTSFAVPDRALWEPGYAAEAARSLLAAGLTLDSALAVVGPFLNPLLDGTAAGTWNPDRGIWVT